MIRNLGRALRRPGPAIGFVMVLVWVLCALFAGSLAPYNPLISQVPLQFPFDRAPDGGHFWLGTDLLGRDILSRLIHGARTVVFWASLAASSA